MQKIEMSKQAKMGALVWVVIVIGFLLVGIVGYMAIQPGLVKQEQLPVNDDTGKPAADITVCDAGTKVTVTFAARNAVTGAAAGGTHAYRLNGGAIRTVADAGTATLAPNDKITVLLMNESKTAANIGFNAIFKKVNFLYSIIPHFSFFNLLYKDK